MSYSYRLKHSEVQAFLFYFRHQDETALITMIKQWQEIEDKDEATIEDKKINMIVLLTNIIQFLIQEGFSSTPLMEKNEFIITIIKKMNSLPKLHQYEKQVILEYYQIFLLKFRKTDNLIVNHILNYLYVRLHLQVSIEEIATSVKASKGHCSRVFKKTMGYSILHYYTLLKMERAEFFLKSTNKSLTDISLTLGFHDQSHFTKTFKKYKSLTPKRYRLEHQL